MGLLPLEFTECLQDSPYFRDSLISHEKELERTSNNMKELIKEVKNLLSAARSKLFHFNTRVWLWYIPKLLFLEFLSLYNKILHINFSFVFCTKTIIKHSFEFQV